MISIYITWTVVVLAILIMFRILNTEMFSYKCPQCGTTDGKHSDNCSFKGKF